MKIEGKEGGEVEGEKSRKGVGGRNQPMTAGFMVTAEEEWD